jgi:hypothetical protein
VFKKFRFSHIHPVLFSLFPALAMLAANIGYIPPSSILHPLVFSLAVAIILYLIAALIVKKWDKAALITTVLLLAFFTFGHLYDLLKGVKLLSVEIGRMRYLLPAVLVLTAGLCALILLKGRRWRKWNEFLTYVAIAAVVLVSVRLALLSRASSTNTPTVTADTPTAVAFAGVKRDVYYIILDKYTRDDYLLKDWGLDTSAFTAELEDLGFYVAKCSQANYNGTALSMASSLNYEYLDELAPEVIEKNLAWVNFTPYIHDSRARQFFDELGYKFVTAETAYQWVEIKDSDVYIKPIRTGGTIELTSFDKMFLESTLVRPLYGISLPGTEKNVVSFERSHYERVLFILDQMKKIPEIPGPKFVYLHLVVPHNPYVFTPDGQYALTEDDNTGYMNNIQFIDNQIVPVLKEIIEKSEVPPIIILQGDHGYGEDAYYILNAYYLPDGGEEELYPGITPVNTFRLIMDRYFGTNMGLLEDTTYTWKWEDVYNFGILENTCSR